MSATPAGAAATPRNTAMIERIVRAPVRYPYTFVSGGGDSGLCSHFRGVCTQGEGRPEDRGSLFHAVEITVSEAGAVSGRVIQAFARPGAPSRIRFGDG